LYRSNNHHRNFLDCVKTRQKTICSIETAVRSDTICHQDDIAIRLGRRLRWDLEKEEFINDEQANRMLMRPMRSPWRL
ncbi:MAG: gfo/Idh/MocA family oxidoreductase, partial [Planctomycetota bacterium]